MQTIRMKAKDILRASGLRLLSEVNIHVKEKIRKVKKAEAFTSITCERREINDCRWVSPDESLSAYDFNEFHYEQANA